MQTWSIHGPHGDDVLLQTLLCWLHFLEEKTDKLFEQIAVFGGGVAVTEVVGSAVGPGPEVGATLDDVLGVEPVVGVPDDDELVDGTGPPVTWLPASSPRRTTNNPTPMPRTATRPMTKSNEQLFHQGWLSVDESVVFGVAAAFGVGVAWGVAGVESVNQLSGLTVTGSVSACAV